jgi:plasmid stabilization system protein ParE
MVKWTPKSEIDLNEMREYIAENFNVDLAIKIVNDLIDTIETMLTDNPLIGKILYSNPLFSSITFKGNSVFYCENPKDKNIYIIYVQPRGTNFSKERLGSIDLSPTY